ncbi:pentatricopeptide repeat-containing protein [Dorcoceras hygrometricum]|uniref:Pentatricopeptide repeat-containing protein n=1 Tax=Dorcoceras hygrometricum TaxID=472368 RepID=A0A2Z6ZXI9_9LAMI|nr:pentatricopeptide repeat-containing protein [Dorcoceras hygrometricum]
MADARLPHRCAYKYQRTTTEFLTPFRNPQSENQHFFATKCCGNSSRFLAKVLCKRRTSRSNTFVVAVLTRCTSSYFEDERQYHAPHLLAGLSMLSWFLSSIDSMFGCSPLFLHSAVPCIAGFSADRGDGSAGGAPGGG